MNKPQPWKLLSTKDVSVGKWFPLEERTYELPDGRIVDDFTVTTLADVAMVVPLMKDGTVAMCHQFKPGVGGLAIEFPAGRIEDDHADLEVTARAELRQETGIVAGEIHFFGELVAFPTKASERIKNFYVLNAEISVAQELDENENIEVMFFTPQEIDQKIKNGEINTAPSIAAWFLLRLKHPELFP